ncbi:YtxH domain-containing protein [Alkalihalobacillus sp. MEB130]|uniref:YtxH domain-containing protein n=1 Tax=Alkalihalobacillus sp. MEB130 TaxID=2976704 RepID=UPI0028DDC8F1|nr:YtxH domain-containing protein [Alkalihalobacillus sp. MEB130]MDT8862020.1 YtxH domain-containing protein [Alkalihalobacillus sp. MEB130]
MIKAKSLCAGLLVGSVVAGALTLLTTPTSGKTIRTNCKENTVKIQKELQQLSSSSKAATIQLKTTATLGKDSFTAVGSEVKDSLNSWKHDVEPTLNQLRKDIEDLQKSVDQTRKSLD